MNRDRRRCSTSEVSVAVPKLQLELRGQFKLELEVPTLDNTCTGLQSPVA